MHRLESARIEAFGIALSDQPARRPFPRHEKMVTRDLVVIRNPGSRPFHLNPSSHRRWQRHFPLYENRHLSRSLKRVPHILGFRQAGIDSPCRLVQPLARSMNVEVHHFVITRPRTRRKRRPPRRGQGREHPDHRTPRALPHQSTEVRHMAGVHHVLHEFHTRAIHSNYDRTSGRAVHMPIGFRPLIIVNGNFRRLRVSRGLTRQGGYYLAGS